MKSDNQEGSNYKSKLCRVAILIPCYNEALTIGKVIKDFQRSLPEAIIYVYDNNSTDSTVEEARHAGAIICRESRQGKGFVVQTMFHEVDADLFVIVDGDDTYPASEVRRLLSPIEAGEVDMVVGSRLSPESVSEFKKLNRFGNNLFLATINYVFGVKLTDILSGYRAFNRRFVKTLPLFGGGFETETELTIKALSKGFRVKEVPINLGSRPSGSNSKINLFRDGTRILLMIVSLFRDYKPLTFFGSIGTILFVFGCISGSIVVIEFVETGLVLRMPTALLAVGLTLSGMLLFSVGLVLHTVVRRSQESDFQFHALFEEILANRNQYR